MAQVVRAPALQVKTPEFKSEKTKQATRTKVPPGESVPQVYSHSGERGEIRPLYSFLSIM
jgi:hypothetical protein